MAAWKKRLQAVVAVLGFMGLVTFAEFIVEESFQTVMFGTWAAQDAGDWETVKIGIDLMQRFHRLQLWVNYCIGWAQPLAFLAYGSYANAEAYYIRALRAKCFAHAPRLFIGERISFRMTGFSVTTHDNGLWIERWPLRARLKERPTSPSVPVSGIARSVVIDSKEWVAFF